MKHMHVFDSHREQFFGQSGTANRNCVNYCKTGIDYHLLSVHAAIANALATEKRQMISSSSAGVLNNAQQRGRIRSGQHVQPRVTIPSK
jgi:hypothetical protein